MTSRVSLPLAVLGVLLAASNAGAQTSSPSEIYAKACREAIGSIPDFSCAEGVIVPVTVDGEPARPSPHMTCDRPALLLNDDPQYDGQCVPFSRILSLSTKTMQVAVMCRQKKIRSSDSLDFDEIDVIAHNPATGATCWFQAVGKDGKPVNGAHIISPTARTPDAAWKGPQETAIKGDCGGCHDNGPIVYSPFVGQVRNAVPVDPLGPYFHVDPDPGFGFSKWPTAALTPRDNTCVGCHRIGVEETCGDLTLWMTGIKSPPGADAQARRFPLSHGMPPPLDQTLQSWKEIYGASVAEIRSCCLNHNQPSCNKTKIAAYPPG